MSDKTLTEAQQRALDWLPKDGAWRVVEKGIGRAIGSLEFYAPGCVEREFGNFGPRGGNATRWRLTAKGIARFHAAG